jgi:hypothetical protein
MCEQPGGTYWLQWRAYTKSELLGAGMISPEDMNLFFITDDPAAAVEEVCRFYRVYHSMRFVGDELVLRLEHRVRDETVEALNDQFGQIITGGKIEQCEPLPPEANEFPDKPRLKLRFNRRDVGLLRLVINRLNAEPDPNATE